MKIATKTNMRQPARNRPSTGFRNTFFIVVILGCVGPAFVALPYWMPQFRNWMRAACLSHDAVRCAWSAMATNMGHFDGVAVTRS